MSIVVKVVNMLRVYNIDRDIAKWERLGCPVPPPHVYKQRVIKSFADAFNLRVLVESGTYYGDMVEAMKGFFDVVYSIELSTELFAKAQNRFRKDENVSIIQGDSGCEIGKIVANLEVPALFWLDGHYSSGETAKGSKDTPIFEELESVLASKGIDHVILIDDARCFGTDPSYPTIEALTEFVRSRRDNVKISVEGDCIRITPLRST